MLLVTSQLRDWLLQKQHTGRGTSSICLLLLYKEYYISAALFVVVTLLQRRCKIVEVYIGQCMRSEHLLVVGAFGCQSSFTKGDPVMYSVCILLQDELKRENKSLRASTILISVANLRFKPSLTGQE